MKKIPVVGVGRLAQELRGPDQSHDDARDMVDRVFDRITVLLEDGNDVRIQGFGTFKRRLKKASRRRHPVTGETTITVERHAVTFKETRAKS